MPATTMKSTQSASASLTNIVTIEDLDTPLVITLEPDNDAYAHLRQVAFAEKPSKFMTESTSMVTGQELQRYP